MNNHLTTIVLLAFVLFCSLSAHYLDKSSLAPWRKQRISPPHPDTRM